MLKDITFGQYIFGRTPLHRLDPRLKLVFTIMLIVMLFSCKTAPGFLLNILFIILLYVIARIPFNMALRSIRPIVPILLFTGILNMFFVTGAGEPLIHFWIISIYTEGIVFAVVLGLRIACLVAGTALLTYTTSPIELTDAIERLLWPFKYLKLPVHELAMMMTIALRFIPTLIDETVKIMNAQKSRGADLDSGKLMQRVRALVPVLVPLFVSSFRRADDLALAMECRCYRGGEGRTRMKQLRLKRVDLFSAIIFVVVFAGIFVLNAFLPHII